MFKITHETGKATALGKHHYDDKGDILTPFVRNCRKGRMRFALRARVFWTRSDSATKSWRKGMTIRRYRAKIQSPIKTIVRNLDKFQKEIHWQRPPNAFNTYQLLHLCRRWKLVRVKLGKVWLKALARPMYPHLTEDMKYFEVGSDGALFEKYDGQPVNIWMTEWGSQLREELGQSENVYNRFWYHTRTESDARKRTKTSLCLVVVSMHDR